MGGSAPAPTIIQAPPPPPVQTQNTSSQSLQTQTALNEISGQQQRLNMTLGSQLDQANSAFFTDQNIRQGQATGAEARTTLQTQGEQQRLGLQTQYQGEANLANIQGQYALAGTQTQAGAQRDVAGTQAGAQLGVAGITGQYGLQQAQTGAEAQKSVAQTQAGAQVESTRMAGQYGVAQTAETGTQARLTQAQQQAYDNYKAQRDYQWSRRAYKA